MAENRRNRRRAVEIMLDVLREGASTASSLRGA
jgi:hypothetical protein